MLREEDGDKPIDEEYANVVLNPQAVAIYNQAKQAEQFGGGAIGGRDLSRGLVVLPTHLAVGDEGVGVLAE